MRIARCGVCHSDLHMQDGYFRLGDGKQLDVRAGRTLPFTLGHEIAGVVESAGPDASVAPGAQVAIYPWIGCGACRRLQSGRREHLRCAAPSRHHGRRRFRHPCADPAPALPDRLRAAVALLRRRADVLGADRLCCAQAPQGSRRARAAAAGGLRRRRTDGAGAGARHVWHGALRRRHRCEEMRGRARRRRAGRLRSGRCGRAQGAAESERRHLRGLRFRRLRQARSISPPACWPRAARWWSPA